MAHRAAGKESQGGESASGGVQACSGGYERCATNEVSLARHERFLRDEVLDEVVVSPMTTAVTM